MSAFEQQLHGSQGLVDLSIVEIEFSESLRKITEACKPQYHPLFDGCNCVGCGDPINVIRLKLGKVRCVECQTLTEKSVRKFH